MAEDRGLTLVTVLFDLARREGSGRRTAQHYLEAAAWLLAVDRDLVVYADPEIAPDVAQRRVSHGHEDRTAVVPLALEEVAAYRHLAAIQRAHATRYPGGRDAEKDTPLYTVVLWARFDLVEDAIARHVRGDGPVALIGLDLSGRPHPRDDPFAEIPDGIRALLLCGFGADVVDDRWAFCERCSGRIGAGFVTGGQAAWRALAASVRREAESALAEGLAPTDEQLLTFVAAREPDRFALYPGSHEDILSNARRLRTGAGALALQLRAARSHDGRSAWIGPPGPELCARVLAALDAGELEAQGKDLAMLLDECFLAAYSATPEGRDLARGVRERYLAAVRADAGVRDHFLLHEVRMRANFAYADG